MLSRLEEPVGEGGRWQDGVGKHYGLVRSYLGTRGGPDCVGGACCAEAGWAWGGGGAPIGEMRPWAGKEGAPSTP